MRTLYDRAGMPDMAKQQLEQYLGLKSKQLGGSELANLFNTHLSHQISEGPQDPHQLVGISRSANANTSAFDLNAPIVVFFSGSHSSSDAFAYPAVKIAGPDARVPHNFLAVDYRGFGQSSDNHF